MDKYPLAVSSGRLTDSKFEDKSTCLVFGVNASSYKLSGIAKDVREKYAYADVFEGRRQLHNLNRCVWYDRPSVGSIIVKEPPAESNYPYVTALVLQYGPGEWTENNPAAQYHLITAVIPATYTD